MTTATKTKRTIKSKRKSPTKRAVDREGREQITTKPSRPAGTFTTVDIAVDHGVNAKTLRARIRRSIDDWEPLFVDGQRHVFKDNKTTRAKIDALLA